MLKRAQEENRPDDTPDVIARRLEIYHQQTEPIVEHYRATGKLVPLHGELPAARQLDDFHRRLGAGGKAAGR